MSGAALYKGGLLLKYRTGMKYIEQGDSGQGIVGHACFSSFRIHPPPNHPIHPHLQIQPTHYLLRLLYCEQQ